jgi:hypothetical protein
MAPDCLPDGWEAPAGVELKAMGVLKAWILLM